MAQERVHLLNIISGLDMNFTGTVKYDGKSIK